MKLWRSNDDYSLAGVCGGLAENLGWDSGRLRIVWVLMTLGTGGGGLLAYLALWYLMPEAPLPKPKFDTPPLQPWKRGL
jgi:phage shock protein PspC (stress-responsive transcriptional regulator)